MLTKSKGPRRDVYGRIMSHLAKLKRRREEAMETIVSIDNEVEEIGRRLFKTAPRRQVRRKTRRKALGSQGGLRGAILGCARPGSSITGSAMIEALETRYKGKASSQSRATMIRLELRKLMKEGFFTQTKKRGPYKRTDKRFEPPVLKSSRKRQAVPAGA